MDKSVVHEKNSLFWDTEGNDVLGATSLPLYGAFVSEEKCQLFGDVSGKKILEIGCENGQSLQYLGERKASELWGVDIWSINMLNRNISFTWFGFGGFCIKTPGNKEILIDPWIKNNPSCPETIKNIEKVDYILFTHAHRDHAEDAV